MANHESAGMDHEPVIGRTTLDDTRYGDIAGERLHFLFEQATNKVPRPSNQ